MKMNKHRMGWIGGLVFLVSMTLGGCATYEYQIVQPADLAGHIGGSVHEVKIDPLVYKMQSYQNHLVVQIFNPTGDAVQLIGEQSSVVTPDKQSIPMQSQAIAPGSYAKLVLPPLRAEIQPTGPSIGIGLGMRVDASGPAEQPIEPMAMAEVSEPARSAEPVTAMNTMTGMDPGISSHVVYLVDLEDHKYWDWDGETDVTLILSYRQGDKTFTHQFLIHRVKR